MSDYEKQHGEMKAVSISEEDKARLMLGECQNSKPILKLLLTYSHSKRMICDKTYRLMRKIELDIMSAHGASSC